jgi:hypothetical protein
MTIVVPVVPFANRVKTWSTPRGNAGGASGPPCAILDEVQAGFCPAFLIEEARGNDC